MEAAMNPAKFPLFSDNRDNVFQRQQGTFSDDFKPYRGFVQFLEHDFKVAEALTYAARNDQLSTVALLLDLGAPVDGEPYYGTALHWAAFFGKRNAVELLVQRGADVEKKDCRIGGTPAGWASVFHQGEELQALTERLYPPQGTEITE
jgi:hypothetical protein